MSSKRGIIFCWLLFLTSACRAGAGTALHSPPDQSGSQRAQIGLASYYGPGLHGERTASGEIFNQNELVAAHPTLPFGTIVRLTNLENGRQVLVRIIDRGPFGRNRRKGVIIDVAQAAAERLRFTHQGIVRVRLEIVRAPGERRRDPPAGPR